MPARRRSPQATCLACLALVLATTLPACGSADDQGTAQRHFLRLEVTSTSDEVVDLIGRARAEGAQELTLDHTPRPVELLDVLDVHVLRIRSERGEERVRLDGVHGDDERLPTDVRAGLRDAWRAELRQWLTAPGTRLVEVPLAQYKQGTSAIAPDAPDLDRLRRVAILRVAPNPDQDGEASTEDVATQVVARGWGRPGHVYQDFQTTEPRLVYALEEAPFAHATESAQVLCEEIVEDILATEAIDAAELQRLGTGFHEDIADWLAWTPAAALEFRPVDRGDAFESLRPFVETNYQAAEDWLRAEGRLGPDGDASPEQRRATLDELVASQVEDVHGYSPAGNVIYILRKPEYSLPMLKDVLIHEIMHHYQEELLGVGKAFPPASTPARLGEAHAEYLASRYRLERVPRYERFVAVDSPEETWHFKGILEDTGLEADLVYRNLLDGTWNRSDWTLLANSRIGRHEFLFRQLGRTAHDGLDFEALRHPDNDAFGRPSVRITNLADSSFRGLFHGKWTWEVASDPSQRLALESPPFLLQLAPQASVNIQISTADYWAADPPAKIIGSFSRTY